MSGYTKLFSSILASTVWREDNITRLVWITLLAMSDKNGVAEGSIPGLADFARVSVAEAEAALKKLSSPDSYSRSKEHDGRRICEISGGWQILNHAKYRAKMSADERREYLRVKQAEYRSQKQQSTNVNNVSDTSTVLTHTEADTEAKADTEPKADQRVHAERRQGLGAATPGSLPRDHMFHAICGPKYRLCLSSVVYGGFARRYGGDELAAKVALTGWVEALEREVGDGAIGDHMWLTRHFDVFLESVGRAPKAPAKVGGKPVAQTADQIKAELAARAKAREARA